MGAAGVVYQQSYILIRLSKLDILHVIGKLSEHRIFWSTRHNDQSSGKGRDIWINDSSLLTHANRIVLRQTKCNLCYDQLKYVLRGL